MTELEKATQQETSTSAAANDLAPLAQLLSVAMKDVERFRAAAEDGVPLRLGGEILARVLKADCGLSPELFADLERNHPILPRDDEGLRCIAREYRANLETLRTVAEISPGTLTERYRYHRLPHVPSSHHVGHGHPPHGNLLGVLVIALAVVIGLSGFWLGLRLVSMRTRLREAAWIWFHTVGLWSLCLSVIALPLLFALRDGKGRLWLIVVAITAFVSWELVGIWRVRRAYPAANTIHAGIATLCGGITTFGVFGLATYVLAVFQ